MMVVYCVCVRALARVCVKISSLTLHARTYGVTWSFSVFMVLRNWFLAMFLVFVTFGLVLLLHDTFSRPTSHPERLPNIVLYVQTEICSLKQVFPVNHFLIRSHL
jgi:hypothetical protein